MKTTVLEREKSREWFKDGGMYKGQHMTMRAVNAINLLDDIDELEGLVKRLADMLEHSDRMHNYCSQCEARADSNHEPDCKLVAALKAVTQ